MLFNEIIKNTIVTSHNNTSNTSNSNYPIIGTHDGTFHCDESLAISLLKLLPQYEHSIIIRTRKQDLLNTCNIVVDVGAIYNPDTLRFDHHQREFTDTLDGYETKLSSAGLVYKHFGKDIIRNILTKGGEFDERLIDICYVKLYKGFIEHIDAIDNGISVSDGPIKYNISTTLSNRVGYLNPQWNEPQTPEILNERFLKAMELTGTEFIERVNSLAYSWWPARSIIENAIKHRFEVHPSGKIIILEHFCPWKEHLFEIEVEENCSGEILYALYEDTSGGWRIQAVPVDSTSFDSRKKLPSVWCGIRDEALSALVGIDGAVFVHAAGFIGGHRTKEGALSMAIQALDLV